MAQAGSGAAQQLRIAVGIATVGRPEILIETVRELVAQSRPAERIIVCPARPEDAAGLVDAFPQVELVSAGRGLTRQRNAIIRAAADCDVLVFFDDDFIARHDFLAGVEATMAARPDIVVATGKVIADGILGPGFSLAEARRLVADDLAAHPQPPARLEATDGGYGCNFAIRLAPVRAHGLWFDEVLPSYGWLEDLDFSARLQAAVPGSAIVVDHALRGVHMGAKVGRQSGVKLGYSQIANPLYIARKGILPRRRLYRLVVRNTLANLVKSFASEPYIDRRGRLAGNLRGYVDALLGKADPGRIERM